MAAIKPSFVFSITVKMFQNRKLFPFLKRKKDFFDIVIYFQFYDILRNRSSSVHYYDRLVFLSLFLFLMCIF